MYSVKEMLPEKYTKLGFGYYFVRESKRINVLLFGRSQTGKSSIITTIERPQVSISSTGFSSTREPMMHMLVVEEATTKRVFQLNIIDTPGLGEVGESPQATRTDEKLIELAGACIKFHSTTLNVIGFVSPAGKTHLLDITAFQKIMNFLDKSFSEASMMILTHCDEYLPDKLASFENDIKKHDLSAPLYNFCKLGINRYGAINIDKIKAAANEDKNLLRAIIEENLHKNEKMREALISTFISCADKKIPVGELKRMKDKMDKARNAIVEERIKEIHTRELEKNPASIPQ